MIDACLTQEEEGEHEEAEAGFPRTALQVIFDTALLRFLNALLVIVDNHLLSTSTFLSDSQIIAGLFVVNRLLGSRNQHCSWGTWSER